MGGLDEAFAVAFNDVDFCLRVREAGYRIVWTPYAQLTHYESKSRGGDEKDPVKARRFASEQQRLYDVHGKANILDDQPQPDPRPGGFFRERRPAQPERGPRERAVEVNHEHQGTF